MGDTYYRPRTARYRNFLKEDNQRIEWKAESAASDDLNLTKNPRKHTSKKKETEKMRKNGTTNIGKVILGYVYIERVALRKKIP